MKVPVTVKELGDVLQCVLLLILKKGAVNKPVLDLSDLMDKAGTLTAIRSLCLVGFGFGSWLGACLRSGLGFCFVCLFVLQGSRLTYIAMFPVF